MYIKKQIVEVLEDMQRNEMLQIRPAYSGRGMYGSTCVGVVHSGSSAEIIMDFVKTAIEFCTDTDDLYNMLDEMGKPNQDSMGRDTITYFPRLKNMEEMFTDEVEDEEDK